MFKRKTVFVLGAGASLPYGYPLGAELKTQMISLPDMTAVKFVDSCKFGREVHADFARRFRGSACSSIDEFLEVNKDCDALGRLLIAYFIMRRENTEWFPDGKPSDAHPFGNPSVWYDVVLNAMLGRWPTPRGNRLSFVTFNYDLSLEYFFESSLNARFGWSREKVADEMAGIPIVHIHGTVGNLGNRRYGETQNPDVIGEIAKSIRIFGDDEDGRRDEVALARHLLDESEFIFYLGFGFHDVNMKRLGWDASRYHDRAYAC